MGEIADKYAECIIVTDDNPRSEDPKKIVSDILSGCTNNSVEIIHDRELAIRSALQQAGPDDCVVIAGKGHEIYQETSGKRTKFSDRKLLKKMILAHQART
jgi:UDP-N-acetylmuramoyl-L-alanyl-D-glutamate--2,6-diaminopimelate ligase